MYRPRGAKIERLKNLAMRFWDEVIPEHGTERFKKLKSDEIQKGFSIALAIHSLDRWSTVRNEVEKYETKDQILYVLDWGASSGNFHWVE